MRSGNTITGLSEERSCVTLRRVTLVLVGYTWPPLDSHIDAAHFSGMARAMTDQLETLASIAASRGGKIDEFLGGYALLSFEPPLNSPDANASAWSALQVAMDIRTNANHTHAGNNNTDLDACKAQPRIALCTGAKYSVKPDSSSSRTHIWFGSTTDRAVLLNLLARPGRILCDSATWEAIKYRVEKPPDVCSVETPTGDRIEVYDILGQAHADSIAVGKANQGGTLTLGTPANDSILVRRQGDFWTIAGAGRLLHVNDSKGMNYLVRLLERPNLEIHALELAGVLVQFNLESPTPDAHAPTALTKMDMPGLRDTGALLDARAKADYRQRVRDLEDEFEEATRMGDVCRASRAAEERYVLMHELAVAVGLGGRDRRSGSLGERARINVTRALRAAISRIASQCPELGHHLDTSVRTGTFCSYCPPSTTTERWQF